MNWTSLRERAGDWGAVGFCALLSLGAFYLLIFYGAFLSKVILLGVMLICPVVYFIARLMGGNSRGGGRVMPVEREKDPMQRPVTRTQQPVPHAFGSGPK